MEVYGANVTVSNCVFDTNVTALHIASDSPTVVSGNVSFYNQSAAERAVPPTPIVACFGVIQDHSKAITLALEVDDEAGGDVVRSHRTSGRRDATV